MDNPDSAAQRAAFIVVHGVGAVKPGAMLRELVGELGGPIDEFRVDSETYPRARLASDHRFAEGYEVYWAGLKPGPPGLAGTLLRPFHVFLALSQLGANGWRGESIGVNEPSVCGRILHIFLWAFALGLPALEFPLIHLACLPGYLGILAAIASVMPTLYLAWQLRTLDKITYVPLIATPILVGLAFSANRLAILSPAAGAVLLAQVLTATYAIVVALNVGAALELSAKVARAWRGGHPPPAIAVFVRLAALSLPFTIVGGGFGAITWALNLSIYKVFPSAAFSQWGSDYVSAFPFDLALIEFAYAATTFALGAFLALGFGVFVVLLSLKAASRGRWPLGGSVRNWLAAALVLLFVGNTSVADLLVLNGIFFPGASVLTAFPVLGAFRKLVLTLAGSSANGGAVSVWVIYAASSVRLVGFLPGLLGPLRTAANLAADVALYLAPTAPLSYADAARQRLVVLIEALRMRFGDRIFVLSYSQGTMITVDALQLIEEGTVSLVTAGSPLDTLYERFLRVHPAKAPAAVRSWDNFYRDSDYIGGSVRLAARNHLVTEDYPSNHLDYFHEPEILQVLP